MTICQCLNFPTSQDKQDFSNRKEQTVPRKHSINPLNKVSYSKTSKDSDQEAILVQNPTEVITIAAIATTSKTIKKTN